MTLLGDG